MRIQRKRSSLWWPESVAATVRASSRVCAARKRPLARASPYIAEPAVAIDGHTIGYLQNGGFLVANVPAGEHALIVGVGSEPTVRGFVAAPGSEVFFEANDKSRMAGERAAVAGMAGGAVGGLQQALQEQEEAAERSEGRFWAVDLIPAPVALQELQNLALSE